MNFSTNQVMQLFVLGSTDTAKVKQILTPDQSAVRGYIVKIKNSADEVIDVTDIIDAKNILSVTEALATSEKIARKGLLVKLNPDVNGGQPEAGEEYVITLTYRGFGEEDTYAKVVSAKASKSDNAATLLQKLAKSFLDNKDVEYSPLYELHFADGSLVTEANYNTITADGFTVVEPVPYWSLGRFAETLMKIDVQTAPVTIEGEEEGAWLANYKFAPVSGLELPNSKRVADLEYFCKGERGTSNALVGWPDTPDYVAKVNPNSATGYDILTVHCAYVGANASNQKSEKDIVFVIEGGASTINKKLSDIKADLAKTTPKLN